jgi:hypothetical protein
LAGSGDAAFADGQGPAASFRNQGALALEGDGNVLVADAGNHRIRKISPEGLVSTLAGSGAAAFADGQGPAASFAHPHGLALDGDGNVLVADWGNHRIRKIVAGLRPRSASTSMHLSGDPPRSLSHDLATLLVDPSYADVTFVVNDEQIMAHKGILAARSLYFSTMLRSSFQEAQPGALVEIQDTSAAAFKNVLQFLYTDKVLCDDVDVIQTMRLAHRYEIFKVYSECKSRITRDINASNCIDWLLQASEHGLTDLRGVLVRSVARYLQGNTIQRESGHAIQRLASHQELMQEVLYCFQNP